MHLVDCRTFIGQGLGPCRVLKFGIVNPKRSTILLCLKSENEDAQTSCLIYASPQSLQHHLLVLANFAREVITSILLSRAPLIGGQFKLLQEADWSAIYQAVRHGKGEK